MRRTNQSIVNQAAVAAVSKPRLLPELPTEKQLAADIKSLNQHQGGPDTVYLVCINAGWHDACWGIGNDSSWPHADHTEEVPGDGKRFDHVAAARRLLFAAKEAGY